MTTPRIGRLHKLYVDADGDIATPTWVEYGEIQGGNRSQGKDLAEIKERGLDETVVLPGHKTREVSITLTKRPGNVNFDILQTAFETDAKVGIAMMTGPIATSGEQGYQAEMYVTQFDDNQENDSTTVNCTLKAAADYVTPPDVVEIA